MTLSDPDESSYDTMSKQARMKTQEMRRAQQEAASRLARRRRVLLAVGGLLIVGLVAAIVVALVNAGGNDRKTAGSDSGTVVTPKNITATGAIPVGQADAAAVVEIYYDYMCPACGAFEAANGSELSRLVEEGVARVELRPISFLDRQSNGSEYSTRTANAIATVADGAPDNAWAFHKALYEQQPAEGTGGLTDEQIADIAADSGVPATVVERFADRTYEPWVASVTEKAFASGVKGTPTVKIDGEVFTGDLYTAGPLTAAVESKAGAR